MVGDATLGMSDVVNQNVHKGVSRAAHYDHGCLRYVRIRWQEKEEGRSQVKMMQ